MEVAVLEKNGIPFIRLNGRMDATTVANFEEICSEIVAKNNPKIIISLEELEYISSAGLRGILLMEKLSKKYQTVLVFFGLQKMVQEVFNITGFTEILKICDTYDDAVAI